MMTITFEIETEEDLEMLRNFFAEKVTDSENSEEIQKLKKSEYNRKYYQNKKNKNTEITDSEKIQTDSEISVTDSENSVTDSEISVTDSENSAIEATQDKEEREGKEEVSPLSSPPSLPPCTPYPIPPYNPPLPEEREEREEKTFLAVGSKRGQLIGFGDHGHVKLSQKEYDGLVKKWGEEKTKRMIQNMDDYLEEDPKRLRKYETRNHNLTLQNWDRMDNDRRQKQEKPREKTFGDIRREMESQSQDSFIESFWRQV